MRHGSRLALAALLALAPMSSPASAQDSPEDALNQAAIEWVGLLRDQHFDSAAAKVAPPAQSQMDAAQLEAIWGQLGAQLGAMESLTAGTVSEQQGYQVVDLSGVFANGTFTVRVVLDDEHRVGGFFIVPPGG